jgi:cytochrome c553
MRGLNFIAAAFALAASVASVGQETSSRLGRSLAATCSNCHGSNGVSVGEVASLAGRPKDDIVRKMQAFKTGREAGTIMPQLAKGFTDEQIDSVAAWFAAQTAQTAK